MSPSERLAIPEVYMAVAEYCHRQGWIPVGWRSWTLGPWTFTFNGTALEHKGVPAFHLLIEQPDLVGLMLIGPGGGAVVGLLKGSEEAVIAALNEDR